MSAKIVHNFASRQMASPSFMVIESLCPLLNGSREHYLAVTGDDSLRRPNDLMTAQHNDLMTSDKR